MNIQLVPVDSYSRGIALDCEILERLAGCKARIPANEYFPPLRYLFGDGRSHVSLFVETVPWWAAFLPRRLVWVIWNHEIAKTYPFVWLASRILCKTHIAERIAKRLRLGQPTRIGFTSSSLAEIACPPPAAARPLKAVLHLAGQSTYKQTQQVLQAWVDHPELPRLVVTCFGKGLSIIPAALRKRARAAANVDLWDGPAPREKVEAWLREIPVHLCPSCAEGFGHSLNESRFYGALIISTAAEPMSGYANVAVTGRQRGLFHRIDAEGIARAVQTAVAMSPHERESIGSENQRAFVRDHQAFIQSFRDLKESL